MIKNQAVNVSNKRFIEARKAFMKGEWNNTIDLCTSAITADKKCEMAYVLRAKAQHKKGLVKEAMADLSEAKKFNPDDVKWEQLERSFKCTQK